MPSELKDRVKSWMYDLGVDKAWTPILLDEAEVLIKDQQARIEELEKAGFIQLEGVYDLQSLHEGREKVLVEALEFYAKDANYNFHSTDPERFRREGVCGTYVPVIRDQGKTAREALQTKPAEGK